MITLVDALISGWPNAEWSIRGTIEEYNSLVWKSTDQPQPTEEEIQAKIQELQAAEPLRLLRLERDRLITATDWWVLPDRTPTQAQLDYRQALRDITTQTPALDENGQLTGVTWPEKPAS